MDSNDSQNKNREFAQKNRNYIITAVIIIVLAIIYFASQGKTEEGQGDSSNNQKTEQSADGSKEDTNDETDSTEKNQDSMSDETKSSDDAMHMESGNISAAGTLRASDNLAKGNLMVETGKSKIYISTKRDFSTWVGKSVTLIAQGTMQNFTFLGFKEAGAVQGATTSSSSNDTDKSGLFTFSGKLLSSDNMDKGNYVVTSGNSKIYLKSSKNYSSWVGSEVTLTANGSVKGFTGAKLMKK